MAKPITNGRVLSQRARIGTQREYETVTILRPETSRPDIGELIARMQEVLGSRGAKLMKLDSWGTRVLAFPIAHCRKGIYLYWRYLGGSDVVAEFERHMRLSDKIVRFYTVLVDEDVDPEARPSEVTEELLEAATDPGPDPDELARQAAAEAAAREAASESRRERPDVFEGEEEFNAEGDI
ncbi:MAG: 30S ribosomal protein S6 [Nannocystaceae bacterium]|jgi:small subunit ribosomal protein S6